MVDDVTAKMDRWPSNQRRIGHRLREMILAVDDGLVESIKWNSPTFSVAGTRKHVCSLMCHKTHVNLQLFRGADLKDESGTLEGTGKSMRHLSFDDPNEIPEDVVVDLVAQAVNLKCE